MKLEVNGQVRQVDAPDEMPLLWALRDLCGMTGAKFGCGMAQCGACTVHLDGKAVRSCVVPCGYCQSGQIMSAAALLQDVPDPTDEQIDMAMAGNICRCGTYQRVREAVRRASAMRRAQR